MSVELALARIAELQSAFARPQAQPRAPSATSFVTALDGAMTTAPAMATGFVTPVGSSGAHAVLSAVRNEVGVTEQPPGSNDAPRIAQYRQATVGSGVGPWCAYFVSWAAREAGVPLGDAGQGFGRVDDVWAWAERSGKAIPAAGAKPQPGDLIVWDEHIGVVESVAADGTVSTIEGNSSDSVARRTYGRDGGGAIGYVRLG